MENQKLCLAEFSDVELTKLEQVQLFAATGFEGFFLSRKPGEDLRDCADFAREEGLLFQSVHAPFGKSAALWDGDEAAASAAVEELTECLEATADLGVELMVCHAVIGMDRHTPTEIGLSRFDTVVRRAQTLGVRLALENTEGEEYLETLLARYRGCDAVGFCWDSGHEMCYNHSRDLLAKYGDRLLATHLNDNLGVRSFDGKITWHDDLHLLPFDGAADWRANAARLADCGYDGPLTLELCRGSKPGRHENDKYGAVPFEQYVAEAYARACRIGLMVQRAKAACAAIKEETP